MIRYSVVRIPACCLAVICLLAVCLAAIFCMSCDVNGGGVFSYTGNSRAVLTSLFIDPVKRVYPADKPVFNRREDFAVWGVFPNGTLQQIDSGIVAVSVGEDGDPLLEDTYQFNESGEHFIYISYAGQSGYYAVWVLSGNEAPNWSEGPGGGIIIEIH
jgi:hypothetical protein